MSQYILKLLDQVFDFDRVSAHCDIPCKVYDPFSAQLAALSIVRFIDQIKELTDLSDAEQMAKYIRLINEKEKHAEQVKQHVRVIWGDYYKQPQIDQVPNIHEHVQNIMMAASACKQTTARENADKLLGLVNEFAGFFWLTKGIDTFNTKCPYPPFEEVTYPVLEK
ncbi:MAG: superoxide dismutase, Ni [Pseudomonadota bacterium]